MSTLWGVCRDTCTYSTGHPVVPRHSSRPSTLIPAQRNLCSTSACNSLFVSPASSIRGDRSCTRTKTPERPRRLAAPRWHLASPAMSGNLVINKLRIITVRRIQHLSLPVSFCAIRSPSPQFALAQNPNTPGADTT